MSIEKGFYKHFKGRFYQVLEIARHSETEEYHVVYRPLYDNERGEREVWIRPLAMFDETIERDGKTLKRFAPVSKQEQQQLENAAEQGV